MRPENPPLAGRHHLRWLLGPSEHAHVRGRQFSDVSPNTLGRSSSQTDPYLARVATLFATSRLHEIATQKQDPDRGRDTSSAATRSTFQGDCRPDRPST